MTAEPAAAKAKPEPTRGAVLFKSDRLLITNESYPCDDDRRGDAAENTQRICITVLLTDNKGHRREEKPVAAVNLLLVNEPRKNHPEQRMPKPSFSVVLRSRTDAAMSDLHSFNAVLEQKGLKKITGMSTSATPSHDQFVQDGRGYRKERDLYPLPTSVPIRALHKQHLIDTRTRSTLTRVISLFCRGMAGSHGPLIEKAMDQQRIFLQHDNDLIHLAGRHHPEKGMER